MVATKPSKKQRGKLRVAKTKKEMANTHFKLDDNGDKIIPKKRARVAKKKDGKAANEGSAKSDRSPDAIQQAKYYLEQWQKRNEPKKDDELPWKFKKIKQQWIIRWMYEADVVPKSMFAVVLKYLDSIQGAVRKRVADSAQDVIDIGAPTKEDEEAAAEEKDKMLIIKLARRRYKRALQVAELLA